MTTNASGTIWRVVEETGVARVRVLTPDGEPSDTVTVDSRDLPAGGVASDLIGATGDLAPADQERILVLAERSDTRWRATVDGVELAPQESSDWRQTFQIPAGTSGQLRVWFDEPGDLPWSIAQILVLGLTALLALPTRRRNPAEDA